jgi:hypothetical protein
MKLPEKRGAWQPPMRAGGAAESRKGNSRSPPGKRGQALMSARIVLIFLSSYKSLERKHYVFKLE